MSDFDYGSKIVIVYGAEDDEVDLIVEFYKQFELEVEFR